MADEFDLNQAIEQVQKMLSSEEGEAQIQNLLGMLGGNQESGGKPPEADTSGAPFDLLSGLGDIENIMKIKNIMSLVGNRKNDANMAFLNTLKPYLKKERQQKLDQASRMLSAFKAIKIFKEMGGI